MSLNTRFSLSTKWFTGSVATVFFHIFLIGSVYAEAYQRLGVPPIATALVLKGGEVSKPITAYCLDHDLRGPSYSKVTYDYLHTNGLKVFEGNAASPTPFEVASGLTGKPRTIEVQAYEGSTFLLTIRNVSSAVLTVRFAGPVVFGRSAGLETGTSVLDLLRQAQPYAETDLAAYRSTQDKIWAANRQLEYLREGGFWDPGLSPDAVTPEAIAFAEKAAREWLNVPTGSLLLALEKDLYRSDLPVMATLKADGGCSVAVLGVSIPEVRIYALEVDLRQLMLDWKGPLVSSCRRILRPATYAEYSRRGKRVSIDLGTVPPDKVPPLYEASKDQCSAEFCASTKGETKVGFECKELGIGFSTNGKVEFKAGPVAITVP